jgi:chromosome partitioning protein
MRSGPHVLGAVVACANLKGGVGKSTIAVNLAAALSSSGQPAMLFDGDPQRTSTIWASRGALPVAVRAHAWTKDDEATWLDDIALEAEHAIVVVDCPPSLEGATEALMRIADVVVVPVTASGADLYATRHALELVRGARAVRGGLPAALLVPSRVDRRTASGRELEQALAALGEPVGPAIGYRAKFVDSFTVGDWVGHFAPGSDAAQDIAALADTIMEMLHGLDRKTTAPPSLDRNVRERRHA